MISRPFVIVSATRCGSTTLDRALTLIPGTWVANQPRFDDVILRARGRSDDDCENALFERIEWVMTDHSGIKHVFDPNGFPFQEPFDMPTIADMERDAPLWHRLNAALLNYPGFRVIFLQRRNSFERFVSDHVGHGTGQWGAVDHASVSADERAIYKKRISKLPLPPLDERLTRWYTENIPRTFELLRSAVTNPVLDVWYEDLFGPSAGIEDRIERFRGIVEFLQIPVREDFFCSKELALLLRPSAKLNDASVFERIPNYRAIRKRLGINDDIVGRPGESSSSVTRMPARSSTPTHTPDPGQAESAGLKPEEGEVIVRPRDWMFRAAVGTLAGLVFPLDPPDSVRVEILKADTGKAFDVGLWTPNFKVESNQRCELHFRARAEETRSIFLGVSPKLVYREVEVSPEWRDFSHEFIATGDHDQVGLFFHLGSCATTVELASVRFRRHAAKEELVQLRQELVEARQREAATMREAGTRQSALAEQVRLLAQALQLARTDADALIREKERLEATLAEPLRIVFRRHLIRLFERSGLLAPKDGSLNSAARVPKGAFELYEGHEPPSGSFIEAPPADNKWTLRVAPGCAASLFAAAGYPDAFRVAITKAVSYEKWAIQLNQSDVDVSADHRYAVCFRARSDRPRTIGAGIGRNCEPWTNAGFYQDFELMPEWQTFYQEFTATQAEHEARVHLDLGASSGDIEMTGFHLRDLADRQPVPAAVPHSQGARHVDIPDQLPRSSTS